MKLAEQSNDHWTEKALQIATIAHAGQKRNNGTDYIEHPKRIASKVNDRLKPIALLHDVIEDTNITLEYLKKEGFPSYVLVALDLLTHKKGDSNNVYWRKILTNPDSIEVKLRDIEDNSAESPSEYAIEKYKRALKLFKDAGYSL